MKTQAAVLVETGQPLEIVELDIPALKPGQVLVEIIYSGVCHTQILEVRGHKGKDPYVPHCLGHEGSGVVREIGAGVTKVKPDQQVILSWMKGSGADVAGSVYEWNGKKVNAGGITTFSKYAVISENRLTALPENLQLRDAAFVGCAVATGLGSVFNTAAPRPGQSIVIFGAGGIGLCAIAGAAIAGCTPIIAVDILPEKLEAARKLGATHVINAQSEDATNKIRSLTNGGVDFAIEATGKPKVMLTALEVVRQQGGVAVVIGNAHAGELIQLDPRLLNAGKQLRGTWGGDNVPDRDFPRYCRLLESGSLNLNPLASQAYALSEINSALDDLESGKIIRPVIDLNAAGN